MKPILYEQTATTFTTQGIGVLSDALKCIVTEELNGIYDLEMTYPVNGAFYDSLTLRRIIKAKPNSVDNPQPFRIYKISKPLNGIVTIDAHHITYDLSGQVVPPFTVKNTTGGVIASITGTAIPGINPYYFTNNSPNKSGELVEDKPKSAKGILNDFVDAFGVELAYDIYHITVSNKRGADNGVIIAYGKNLLDLTQEENCSDVCTAVYPYYHSDEADVTLPERIINLPGTYDFTRVVPLDCTAYFNDGVPTEAQLRTAANKFISENNLGVPAVNLTVKYVALEDSDEAIPMHIFERISLGDDISVKFEKLGVNAKSRCVKYAYNVLAEHIESITIGDPKENVADNLAKTLNLRSEVSSAIEAAMKSAIERATALITNGLGGYVIIHKSNSSLANPDELLILGDSPDLTQAQQVWRWNKNGLGYSSTGYNGTYRTAMTSDGQIVADMITTGVLRAIEIYNHSDSASATFHVTSDGVVTATKGKIGGFNIDANSIYNSSIQLHNTSGLRFLNGNQVIGRIAALGTNHDTLAFVLNTAGQTLSWGVEREDGTYLTILSYEKSTNTFSFHTSLDMHNYGIINCGVDTSSMTRIYFSWVTMNDMGTYYEMTIKTSSVLFNQFGQFVRTEIASTNTYNIRKAS